MICTKPLCWELCKRYFSGGQGSVFLRSFTWLKLNWKTAADKGALCGTRAVLIHAEELVSQVGALSAGRNLLKSSLTFQVPCGTALRTVLVGACQPLGKEAGQSRAGCVATTLRSGNNSQVGQ